MSVTDGLGKSLATEGLDGQLQWLNLVGSQTLTGDLVLTGGFRNVQLLDPGGASRNVDLPGEKHGCWFVIFNKADAAEDLTVRDDAASTVATLNQNEAGFFWSDGTSWYFGLFTAPAS